VSHNPIGSFALAWLHQICFREQSEQEFCENTIPAARARQTRVCFDPAALAGDPLEIEACRAAFRDLELSTDRMDLLTGLLEAMVRRHQEALSDVGGSRRFERIVLTGLGAESIQPWLPDYERANVLAFDDVVRTGIAQLFQPDSV
jgi:sugar (pentulose or hexulose) kinase